MSSEPDKLHYGIELQELSMVVNNKINHCLVLLHITHRIPEVHRIEKFLSDTLLKPIPLGRFEDNILLSLTAGLKYMEFCIEDYGSSPTLSHFAAYNDMERYRLAEETEVD